ncbi:hypothetical protein [Phytohabitans kaempferiae]|uniref:Uncharacterized protein n=1 Tax=Phytohabitans kaempferiae TaxID=1620943 RepID=A0ABV6MCE1_9ACTN
MALSGEYTYFSDGTARLDLSDGSSTIFSGSGEDTVILSSTDPDGTVYTEFDAENRPGHVQFPDGNSGDYTYHADGTTRLDLSDGSSTIFSGSGEGTVILSSTDPDGTVYSEFNDLMRPTHVEFAEM